MAELDALRRVGVYEEPAGFYAVDHSATPGDFLAVPYKEGTVTHAPNMAKLNPMTGTLRIDGYDKQILGHKKGTVSLGMTLHSHGVDLDGDAAPPTTANWALLRVLKAVMGGSFATTDESAQTEVESSTATTVTVTTGHGTRFEAGGLIMCQTAAGSPIVEAREVASVAGDVVTVREAFSAAPVESTPVRGGVTCYLTEDPDTSLQVMIQGRGSTDGTLYRGLQLTGGPALELPVGELGTITFALEGGGWDDLGVGTTTPPTIDHYEPMHLAPLEVRTPAIGSTTLVSPCVSAVSVEPAIAYVDHVCGKAENGVARKRRSHAPPVASGTFVVDRDGPTWRDHYADRSDLSLYIQLGALPGGTILLAFPAIQIVDVQQGPGTNDIASQTVSWQARPGSGATERLYSAMRIHFG